MANRKRRYLSGLVPALAIAAAAAVPAGAYQHFSQATGATGVSPNRWQALPVSIVVDNGPTDISAEIDSAVAAWNDIATARSVWGTPTEAVDVLGDPIDFTGANMGTDWGNLTGDGQHEVVFDEDGTALTALGLAPASVNGYGPSRSRVVGGAAVIDDMYLLINGTRTNFDRQATQIHELGHTLGLAHSSVGFYLNKPGALTPVTVGDVPTMHPYSVGGGSQRRTVESDDVASLSELYPEATFATSLGTLTGTVTRCGTDEPVLGANVRAVNASDPAIQLTRVTGFDGNDAGRYTINGVPPGEYIILVEPLSGDADYLNRLAMFTRVDSDFTQEYYNETKESDCEQDTDPSEEEDVAVSAGGSATANLKVGGVELAFVIDVTGSMGPEIGAVRDALNTYITVVDVLPGAFPDTAVVTFTDGVLVNTISRDPDTLRGVVNGLGAGGGDECPEASNQALMTAGRLLARNGRAVLATDADSRPDGPSRGSVNALFTSKGARLSTLLSGVCPPERPKGERGSRANRGGQAGDELPPVDELGAETSIRTFTEISSFTGGLFSFQPEIKLGEPDAVARYVNTMANLAISSVTPAVAAVNPTALPLGTTLELELTGSNTNFRQGSTLAVAGAGVSVLSTRVVSPTRIIARLSATSDAALGFRNVTVTTAAGDGSVETAEGIGALQVAEAPDRPTILAVTPSTAAVGSTVDVTISGGLTNFADGVSVADFGAGVTVNRLTVSSPTSAVANVSIAPGAEIGLRDVTVITGSVFAGESVPGPFLVVAQPPAIPRLTQASPTSGARGSTVDVTLTGADTAFAGGASLTSVTGRGVEVLSTAVSSPTSLVARLRIAGDAPLGFRDLIVTTGGENAALLNGFEVTPAVPVVQPPPGGVVGGGGTVCADRARPAARFLAGKKGVRVKKRKLRVRGRASDRGCVATISVAGRVARVEVAISRKAGKKKCRFVQANGRLTKARSCKKPVFVRAKGTSRWSLSLKRKLPRGRYTIQVRARDAAGNRQSRPAKRTKRI